MFGLLLGFSFGLAVGAWLGRREGRKEGLAMAAASGAAPPPVAPAPQPPAAATPPPPTAAPNKKARKMGLTEADFQPRDDILHRMQEAWERGEHLAPPPDGDPVVDPGLDDRVRRVLERLEGAEAGQGAASMPEEPAPIASPSAGTLTEGVTELTELGYGDDLRFADGVLTCRRCGESHPTEAAEVEQVRRYEGQSDPGDEAILLGLRCPHCGAQGSIVSTYGPDADPELAQAFTYLAGRARHS